ncbi:MAG: hypothetical protein E7605_06540 [Ruminococcaceae bacterium]|nr:hypothetical protein [Oscillospiraceae bacterium]
MMKKQSVETLQRAQGWWNCVADGTAYPFGAGTVKSGEQNSPRRESNPPRPTALRCTAQRVFLVGA